MKNLRDISNRAKVNPNPEHKDYWKELILNGKKFQHMDDYFILDFCYFHNIEISYEEQWFIIDGIKYNYYVRNIKNN